MGRPPLFRPRRLTAGCVVPLLSVALTGCDGGTVDKLALNLVHRPIDHLLGGVIFALPLWLALGVTLGLERLLPAQRSRPLFSAGLAHDLAWFLYEPLLHALIVGTYVALLQKVWTRYLSLLTWSPVAGAPVWSRVVLAVLLLDFCYWLQHVVNHKVPLFWRFHAVHHSQRELNFFTDFRYHPLEYVVRYTVLVIPFLVLRIDAPVIVTVAILREWYSRFYHGNIRTSLGPLKYILVTPQSHRIHHSLERRHRDMNFGAIFSVWDVMFGRQYRDFDEYPDTGIDDQRFPNEQAVTVKSLLLTPWLQMLHPLQRARTR